MDARRWTCLAPWLGCLLILSTASAQEPRRIDPGEPPYPDLGAPAQWEVVTIPGLAAGSSLGNLSVRTTDGVLFVWSVARVERAPVKLPVSLTGGPRRIDPGLPPFPGEGGPGVPDIDRSIVVSTLYAYVDGVWLPSLVANEQTGAFVHATANGDVYASTNLADGSIRVFHRYAAQGWHVEVLPPNLMGPAGAFAGDNLTHMRAGTAILRHWQHEWLVDYACGEFPIGGGLAVLPSGQMMATCEGHEHVYDGARWSTMVESLPTHIHSVWGNRDGAGVLHLFAGGSDPTNQGMLVYEYVESNPGTMAGHFQLSLANPFSGSAPGYVSTIWGEGPHEIYATGVLNGSGQLYRFNGAGWVNAAPDGQLPAIVGVGGTAAGGLWVSLADGRLMHRRSAAGEQAESPAQSLASRSGMRDLAVASTIGPRPTLQFSLPEELDVELVFFDVGGRRVDAISPGRMPAGMQRLTWSAEGLASGTYFCRVDAGVMRATLKVLVQK